MIDKSGKKKPVKPWHLILKATDYPCLNHDSFVKIDQIVTVDRSRITDIKRPSVLTPIDLVNLDLKIISLYEMAKTIKSVLNKEQAKEIECIIRDIDTELKEHVEKGIKDLLHGINKKVAPLIKGLGEARLLFSTIK